MPSSRLVLMIVRFARGLEVPGGPAARQSCIEQASPWERGYLIYLAFRERSSPGRKGVRRARCQKASAKLKTTQRYTTVQGGGNINNRGKQQKSKTRVQGRGPVLCAECVRALVGRRGCFCSRWCGGGWAAIGGGVVDVAGGRFVYRRCQVDAAPAGGASGGHSRRPADTDVNSSARPAWPPKKKKKGSLGVENWMIMLSSGGFFISEFLIGGFGGVEGPPIQGLWGNIPVLVFWADAEQWGIPSSLVPRIGFYCNLCACLPPRRSWNASSSVSVQFIQCR